MREESRVRRFEITVSGDARRPTDDRAFQTDQGTARARRTDADPERAYQTDGVQSGDLHVNGPIAPLAG
jgi:hypothetical protein